MGFPSYNIIKVTIPKERVRSDDRPLGRGECNEPPRVHVRASTRDCNNIIKSVSLRGTVTDVICDDKTLNGNYK